MIKRKEVNPRPSHPIKRVKKELAPHKKIIEKTKE